MPGVTGEPTGLTRQCSHSSDLPTLGPASAPSTHKTFSFMRSSSFSFNKSHSQRDPPPIPECEKEPIFDEIRDCDEAPYPQPPRPRKSSTTGALEIKHKAEYKSFNTTNAGHNRSLSTSLPAGVPTNPPSSQSRTVPMPIPPHKSKWLNKLDPRFNAKLMEERQKTIERQERERQKKREDEQVLEDLLSKWVK